MATSDDKNADAVKRADALLKKHRPQRGATFAGSPAPSLDIPVLTEIVDADAVKTQVSSINPLADVDALSLRLHEEVLRGLQPRINELLDARLAQTLGDLLEQVLRGLEAELKVALRAMVRDAVAAAVDREVLRLTEAKAPATPTPAPPKTPAKR